MIKNNLSWKISSGLRDLKILDKKPWLQTSLSMMILGISLERTLEAMSMKL